MQRGPEMPRRGSPGVAKRLGGGISDERRRREAAVCGRLVCVAVALAWAPSDALRAIAADSTSPRAQLKHDFVVTQLPLGTPAEKTPRAAGEMLRAQYGSGARIIRVAAATGTVKLLTAGFHSACDPEVSYDGQRLLFAAKREAADDWNIFEMAVDGSQVRQITRDLGDCRSPGYQGTYYEISEDSPWDQITFVRFDATSRNEVGGGPVSSLHSCKLDGTGVRRLTYNLSSDYDPCVMWDGRLLYASWQRPGFDHGAAGRIHILGVNTDGADCAAFVSDAGLRIKHMPCTTLSGWAVFVEADRMLWDGAGQLACVSLRRPLRTHQTITGVADGLFHSPSPLPDGAVLVARRPADGSGHHAVYRLEPLSKRTDLVFDDPQWHNIQAKGLAPRARPDGRSSSLNVTDPLGKLYCLNVYTSDLKSPGGLTLGAAKRVRVLEGMPRGISPQAATDRVDQLSGIPQLSPRRILGELPIKEDFEGDVRDYYEQPRAGESPPSKPLSGGSFNVEVPANTPIQLQLLDERGVVLRSCSWIWVRNHQSQGCIGCHEDGELTPTNWQVAALWEDSAKVNPPIEQRTAIDFRRQIVPLLDKKCVACHGPEGSPPSLVPAASDGGSAEDRERFLYRALLAREKSTAEAEPFGKYVHPGRARTSPLVWHVFGQNLSRPWDGAASRQAAVKPIPPDRVTALTEQERQTLVTWIDLGAPWEQPQAAGDLMKNRTGSAGIRGSR